MVPGQNDMGSGGMALEQIAKMMVIILDMMVTMMMMMMVMMMLTIMMKGYDDIDDDDYNDDTPGKRDSAVCGEVKMSHPVAGLQLVETISKDLLG